MNETNGTASFRGIVDDATAAWTATAGTAGGQQATDTFFGPVDLVSLYTQLPGQYLKNAKWMINLRDARQGAGHAP